MLTGIFPVAGQRPGPYRERLRAGGAAPEGDHGRRLRQRVTAIIMHCPVVSLGSSTCSGFACTIGDR